MCAIIRIKGKVFSTVISRAEFYPISKGCRVSRHPSGVKDHPMNRIRKIYRVDRRQRKLYGMLYRRCLTGYLWRDAGVSWNTTPRHFFNVFLHDGSYHPFPQSRFPPVRLHSSFTRCKTGSLPWLAAPLWKYRASGHRLAADRAGEKYANVINRYHNVTS